MESVVEPSQGTSTGAARGAVETRVGAATPLRVAIDAHVVPGEFGGTQQVVMGLAHGLSQLRDGDEEYFFLTYDGDQSWLEPHVAGPCRIFATAANPAPPAWKRFARRVVPFLAPLWRRARYGSAPAPLGPPPSDGAAERLGAGVVHLPLQSGFLTDIPSIYHPHDLQHLHLPEFFTPEQIAAREALYRTLCDKAEMVTVTSQWNKRDLVEHYALPEDKVVVIQLAPALGAYAEPTAEDLAETRRRLRLPERFAYYPAQTWPHKNHVRLLEALAELRDRTGIEVPFVSSGHLNEHYEAIRERVAALRLQDATRFLGFVSAADVQALYRLATVVVVPTLFEAAGGFGPVSEAFLSGTPVAVSNVTSLPEEVDDAALVFDPLDVSAISSAIERLWTDDALRTQLAERGRERVSRFTWERTARTFRAHYRRLAGRTLTAEDEALIAAPPAF